MGRLADARSAGRCQIRSPAACNEEDAQQLPSASFIKYSGFLPDLDQDEVDLPVFQTGTRIAPLLLCRFELAASALTDQPGVLLKMIEVTWRS